MFALHAVRESHKVMCYVWLCAAFLSAWILEYVFKSINTWINHPSSSEITVIQSIQQNSFTSLKNTCEINKSMNSTSTQSLLSENFTSSEIRSEKDNTLSNKEATETSQTEKMPWPAFSEVFCFQPTSNKENNLAFQCKFCVGGKIIYANKSSSANLKKHTSVSYIF